VNAREELALVLANAQRFRNGSSMLPSAAHVSRLALDDADAVLAAGYSKPRTITTVEELDALPDGSMVMDSDPDALLKTDKGWLSVHDNDGYTYPSRYVAFPATVLHEGGAA